MLTFFAFFTRCLGEMLCVCVLSPSCVLSTVSQGRERRAVVCPLLAVGQEDRQTGEELLETQG